MTLFNRKLFPVLLVVGTLFVLVCGGMASTSSSDDNTITETTMRGIPGGYSFADVDDAQVVEAANFAVQSIRQENPSYSFTEKLAPQTTSSSSGETNKAVVVGASKQVVAGMNYRMTIAVLSSSDGGECLGVFKCTVYNHFGDLSVTTWGDEVSCDDDAVKLSLDQQGKQGPQT